MKKFIGILLMVVLSIGLLYGCGASYDAKESTVFVLKNGKVVSTDVEEFDTDTYDEAGLKTYIEEAIASYVKQNGEESVKLNSLTTEDGKAKLIMEYATTEDYMKFNGIELFAGSLAECLAAGYTFQMDFADVTGETIAACNASAFLGGEGYKVVIIKANTNVNVHGNICFVTTENVSLVNKNTISIKEGYHLLDISRPEDEEPEDTETKEQETETETQVEDTGADVEDYGSVGDDELLAGEEEEIVFDFEEEPEGTTIGTGEYSTVYTYIVYK